MIEKASYPSLKDKNILITGGASGIGKSIAEQLLKNKFHVIGSVRKKEDAIYLNEKYNKNFDYVIFDVTNQDSIKKFWSDENQKKLKLQRETINMIYSWDARSVEWKNLFEEARKLKK